jgi:uncharacterized protein YqeY
MDIKTQLVTEMKEAMKSGNAARLSVIRMLRSTIKNKEIDKGKDTSLTDEEVIQVVVSAVKQRKEAMSLFEQGGRADLVEQESKELAILESFLPAQLSEAELTQMVSEAIAESGATTIKQMGGVMKLLTPRLIGKADGKVVSDLVRSQLTA